MISRRSFLKGMGAVSLIALVGNKTARELKQKFPSVPVGTVMYLRESYDGSFSYCIKVDNGYWMPCEGQPISQKDFPEIYELCDGRIPNMRGKWTR